MIASAAVVLVGPDGWMKGVGRNPAGFEGFEPQVLATGTAGGPGRVPVDEPADKPGNATGEKTATHAENTFCDQFVKKLSASNSLSCLGYLMYGHVGVSIEFAK